MKYICLLLMFFFSQCYAEITVSCTYSNSPIQINAAQITVQRDQPVDSPIGNEISLDETNSDCLLTSPTSEMLSGTIAVTASQTNSGKKIDGRNIFVTNLPGVGYAIGINNHAWNNKLHWVGDGYEPSDVSTHSSAIGLPVSSTSYSYNSGSTVHIQLYKIGDMTSGTVTGNIGRLSGAATSGSVLISFSPESVPVNFGAVSINVVKCQLGITEMVFPFGNVPVEQFTSVGSFSQKSSTVNLGLDCDVDANINITLVGVQNPDSGTNKSILALSDQGQPGVAEGVGVQLLYNDAPLEIDKRLELKQSAGGMESFPITARYIQTKNQVIPGKANATAVINVTYQ